MCIRDRVVPWSQHDSLTGGTVDLLVIRDRHLHVIDLKYGRTPVAAENNGQLILYALGAYRQYKRLHGLNQVSLTIYQPRGGGTNTWTLTPGQLLSAGSPYRLVLLEPTKDERPGPWCKWCRRQPICTAFATQFTAAQTRDDDEQDLTAWLHDVSMMLPVYRQFVEDMEKACRQTLMDGHKLPGLKLVHGRGRRLWSAAEQDVLAALRELPLDEDDLFVLRSVAQIEKRLPKALPKDSRERFQSLITRGSPSLRMVSTTDPRPPVGPALDFETQTADIELFTGDASS